MTTFLVIYDVRKSKNRNEEDVSQIETLPDAIDFYCPDADLLVVVDSRRIQLDICRDMYGFHEDLLSIMYAVAFDKPCNNVGYSDVLISESPDQRSYGIMLTEEQNPPLLVFIADREFVYFQTRTLATQGIAELADDVTTPIVISKRDVIIECTNFLMRYLEDLTRELPFVKNFDDYKKYVMKVEAMRVRMEHK